MFSPAFLSPNLPTASHFLQREKGDSLQWPWALCYLPTHYPFASLSTCLSCLTWLHWQWPSYCSSNTPGVLLHGVVFFFFFTSVVLSTWNIPLPNTHMISFLTSFKYLCKYYHLKEGFPDTLKFHHTQPSLFYFSPQQLSPSNTMCILLTISSH